MPNLSRRTFLTTTAGWMVATACSGPKDPPASEPPSEFDLARFLDELQRARPEGQPAVEAVIARAVSNPESVIRQLGRPDQRTADLLYQGEGLSVYNIVFPAKADIAAHDHLAWATIGVYAGKEENVIWRRENGVLERQGDRSVRAGEIFSLPDRAIHSVTNPDEVATAALHVYGADLSKLQGG